MLFKVDRLDDVQEYMKGTHKVSVEEFEKFIFYKSDILNRERLYKNFTNSDGTFDRERMGVENRMILNDLTHRISQYENEISKTPIFDELVEKFQKEEEKLPDFLKEEQNRDLSGRWVEANQGWYQNSAGDLFHYDGVVWDVVPDSIKKLEYLGE